MFVVPVKNDTMLKGPLCVAPFAYTTKEDVS
jgi:hypothetical protein